MNVQNLCYNDQKLYTASLVKSNKTVKKASKLKGLKKLTAENILGFNEQENLRNKIKDMQNNSLTTMGKGLDQELDFKLPLFNTVFNEKGQPIHYNGYLEC
jgi:hypothetical protein